MTDSLRILTLSYLMAAACSPADPGSTPATEGGPTSSGDASGPGPATGVDPSADATADSTVATTENDDDATGGSGLWPAPAPGPDVSVPAFDGQHVYYLSESDNQREAEVEVEFPPAADGYAAITLELGLRCPEGGCDFWDRYGSIAVVQGAGTDDERLVEVARFITPYRVEGTWSLDVSHLRPLLTGTRTLRLLVDTWVGPGHDQGAGWLVDARFELTGGVASPRPVAVIPIFTRRSYTLGDPAQPVSDVVPIVEVDVPEGITSATLVSLITGHGQGNAENCAEFCQDNHGYLLGGQTAVMQTVWRTDCYNNPIADQLGNWSQSRAGWCPGADVLPWSEDITAAADPGDTMSIEYAVSPYENTCRPDAPVCEGCALFTTCEFDGTNHTEPHVRISTVMVAWVD